MVLLGSGWTGKAGQEERARESWSEGGEGTLLGGAEFGDQVPQGGPVCLHPGCSCLWVPKMPLFPLSLGHDSGSHLQEPGEKSFISFLLFFFLQVYLISFELPLFGPKNAQRDIRRSEYFCTSILKDGPSSLAASEIGVAAETGDLLKAAEQARGFLSLGQKSRLHHSPCSSGPQDPLLCQSRPWHATSSWCMMAAWLLPSHQRSILCIREENGESSTFKSEGLPPTVFFLL